MARAMSEWAEGGVGGGHALRYNLSRLPTKLPEKHVTVTRDPLPATDVT